MLHTALQNLGIEPGVLMGVRSRNECMSAGERAFIFASIEKSLEELDVPPKLQNLVSKKKKPNRQTVGYKASWE